MFNAKIISLSYYLGLKFGLFFYLKDLLLVYFQYRSLNSSTLLYLWLEGQPLLIYLINISQTLIPLENDFSFSMFMLCACVCHHIIILQLEKCPIFYFLFCMCSVYTHIFNNNSFPPKNSFAFNVGGYSLYMNGMKWLV